MMICTTGEKNVKNRIGRQQTRAPETNEARIKLDARLRLATVELRGLDKKRPKREGAVSSSEKGLR